MSPDDRDDAPSSSFHDLDLWPERFGAAVRDLAPPVILLKRQAALLGQKTGGAVRAEVETKVHQAPVRFPLEEFEAEQAAKEDAPDTAPSPLEVLNGERRFIHYLYLEAPQVGNYRHALLSVTHALIPYPLTVHLDGAAGPAECADEDEFLEALRRAFHGERTARIIETLIAQSDEPGG
jgi:hypothetical protein